MVRNFATRRRTVHYNRCHRKYPVLRLADNIVFQIVLLHRRTPLIPVARISGLMTSRPGTGDRIENRVSASSILALEANSGR